MSDMIHESIKALEEEGLSKEQARALEDELNNAIDKHMGKVVKILRAPIDGVLKKYDIGLLFGLEDDLRGALYSMSKRIAKGII